MESRVIFASLVRDDVELEINPEACLRTLTVRDVTQGYVDGLNDEEVRKFLVASTVSKQTRESVEAYVDGNYLAAESQLFGLYVSDKLSGTLRLHDVSSESRKGVIGICLFERDIWGRGWGSRSIRRVTQYAFDELGLEMLSAGIYKNNLGAQAAFRKAGYKHNAKRDQTLSGGDAIFMEALKNN